MKGNVEGCLSSDSIGHTTTLAIPGISCKTMLGCSSAICVASTQEHKNSRPLSVPMLPEALRVPRLSSNSKTRKIELRWPLKATSTLSLVCHTPARYHTKKGQNRQRVLSNGSMNHDSMRRSCLIPRVHSILDIHSHTFCQSLTTHNYG